MLSRLVKSTNMQAFPGHIELYKILIISCCNIFSDYSSLPPAGHTVSTISDMQFSKKRKSFSAIQNEGGYFIFWGAIPQYSFSPFQCSNGNIDSNTTADCSKNFLPCISFIQWKRFVESAGIYSTQLYITSNSSFDSISRH